MILIFMSCLHRPYHPGVHIPHCGKFLVGVRGAKRNLAGGALETTLIDLGLRDGPVQSVRLPQKYARGL